MKCFSSSEMQNEYIVLVHCFNFINTMQIYMKSSQHKNHICKFIPAMVLKCTRATLLIEVLFQQKVDHHKIK